MALTHVELYEALRPFVGDEAAQMMAEVIPPAANLTTREDLLLMRDDIRTEMGGIRTEIADLRVEMHEGFAEVYRHMAEMSERLSAGLDRVRESQVSTFRWMIGLMVPVWAGTLTALAAVVVKL
ncbi:MAG: hypothetical protein WD826_02645 [Actinomycetota bacterium]